MSISNMSISNMSIFNGALILEKSERYHLGVTNNPEQLIFFTKEKFRKLISYKDKEDIPDDDFLVYLRVIGLNEKHLDLFRRYLKINGNDKACIRELKKYLSINSGNGIIPEKSESYSLDDGGKVFAEISINSLNGKDDTVSKMSYLKHCYNNTSIIDIKDLYSIEMEKLALKLVEDSKSKKGSDARNDYLLSGFINSCGKAQEIIIKEFLNVLDTISDFETKIWELNYYWIFATHDNAIKMIERVMLLVFIDILEGIKGLDYDDYMGVIGDCKDFLRGGACELLREEEIYKYNINSIYNILKNF